MNPYLSLLTLICILMNIQQSQPYKIEEKSLHELSKDENVAGKTQTSMDNKSRIDFSKYSLQKEEDLEYLRRVGWPFQNNGDPLKKATNTQVKDLSWRTPKGHSEPIRTKEFLTSNADRDGQEPEDSSSRKSNLNIWLTLLIAAVAAAIFS